MRTPSTHVHYYCSFLLYILSRVVNSLSEMESKQGLIQMESKQGLKKSYLTQMCTIASSWLEVSRGMVCPIYHHTLYVPISVDICQVWGLLMVPESSLHHFPSNSFVFAAKISSELATLCSKIACTCCSNLKITSFDLDLDCFLMAWTCLLRTFRKCTLVSLHFFFADLARFSRCSLVTLD